MKETKVAFSNETNANSKRQGIEEVISAEVEDVNWRCHLPSFLWKAAVRTATPENTSQKKGFPRSQTGPVSVSISTIKVRYTMAFKAARRLAASVRAW